MYAERYMGSLNGNAEGYEVRSSSFLNLRSFSNKIKAFKRVLFGST